MIFIQGSQKSLQKLFVTFIVYIVLTKFVIKDNMKLIMKKKKYQSKNLANIEMVILQKSKVYCIYIQVMLYYPMYLLLRNRKDKNEEKETTRVYIQLLLSFHVLYTCLVFSQNKILWGLVSMSCCDDTIIRIHCNYKK